MTWLIVGSLALVLAGGWWGICEAHKAPPYRRRR